MTGSKLTALPEGLVQATVQAATRIAKLLASGDDPANRPLSEKVRRGFHLPSLRRIGLAEPREEGLDHVPWYAC
jgi:hypothetical protein